MSKSTTLGLAAATSVDSRVDGTTPDLTRIATLIFSWALVMPVAVILSGKFLAKVLFVSCRPMERLRIHVPRIFFLEATGTELVLGMTGFIVFFFAAGLCAGPQVHALFLRNFGIDPGRWNALCVFSSLSTLSLSVLGWAIGGCRAFGRYDEELYNTKLDDLQHKTRRDRPNDEKGDMR